MLDASTKMLRSALEAALQECEDIELIEAVSAGIPAGVDVIVLEQRQMAGFPEPFRHFGEGSTIGLVAIDDDGHAGDLYRINHRGWRFGSDSCGLVDAIRAVAAAA